MDCSILISDSVHICQASGKVTGVTIMTSGNRVRSSPKTLIWLPAGCRRYKVFDSKDYVALCVLILTQN